MRVSTIFSALIVGSSLAEATVCWTNGASLLLGRPVGILPGMLNHGRNCNLPTQNGGTGPVSPPANQCPAPRTIVQTVTATVVQTQIQVQWSTTTQTSTTTETSTTTDTSTTTTTTTTTDTSYGINPTKVQSALSRCLGRNPAYTKPLFDGNGNAACCVPITTIGANLQPTGIC